MQKSNNLEKIAKLLKKQKIHCGITKIIIWL